MKPTNLAFLRIAKRAERQDDSVLQKTFVDFGSVFTVISSVDHQIVFGRRGTGKTHLLSVLRQSRRAVGEIAIQIDMRNLGSAGGVYSDPSIPLSQRATRLLVDILSTLHGALLEQAVQHDALVNLGVTGPALDELFEAHREVKVVGTTSIETSTTAESSAAAEAKLGLLGSMNPAVTAGVESTEASRQQVTAKKAVSGAELPRLNFGRVGTSLRKVVDTLPKARLLILLDEWSEIPLDLQPYVADLLRRAVLPAKGITVKVAAIEQRSRFLIPDASVGNIGLEPGADVATSINLDDFMVFDNDEQKAVAFFKALVLRHVQVALEGESAVDIPKTDAELISQGFTQANAFDEAVRACEGVPRDMINILSHAAQRADKDTIAVSGVRTAAQLWYQASKDAAVGAHPQAKALLQWIVDRVIRERQTKAFLLEAGLKDPIIDFLYDERVLHVLRRGVSAKDAPGTRFNVYGIDYGCYVDLINTAKAPRGVLDLGVREADLTSEVPKTDFRSIRRCILDLSDFNRATNGAAMH